MKKKIGLFVLLTMAIPLLFACNDSKDICKEPLAEKNEITLSAAISLTDALNELIASYTEAHPDVSFKTNYAASGDLQIQIEEGAPVDIFISAGKKQMDALEVKDLIDKDSRIDLLRNKEVVVVPAKNNITITKMQDLTGDRIRKLAIGQPESVPAGRYAEQALVYYNLTDQAKDRIVYATNVRQVLEWVSAGEVTAGIVYATDALTEQERVKVALEVPAESHDPIVYPAAVMTNAPSPEAAQAFFTWLQEDEAQAVFEKYGFVIPEAK